MYMNKRFTDKNAIVTEQGQYTHREKFYSFSSDFQHELDARMEERILEVAGDLFETDF